MHASVRVLTSLGAAVGLFALVSVLPGTAFAKQSCVFTLNFPKMHVFPLLEHIHGDPDMQGRPPRVDLLATIHQPDDRRRGGLAKNLRLDLKVKISDMKGDGTAFEGRQNFWITERWLAGGSIADISECLDARFRRCIDIFKKDALSEKHLLAQCGRAAQVRITDVFRADTGTHSRQWTTYQKPTPVLVQSAECIGDVSGADTGKLGCRNITFRPAITIDVNFGHELLAK